MVRKNMQMAEKYHVSNLLDKGGSVIILAGYIGISRGAQFHSDMVLKILQSMTLLSW